jgi:ribosomal 50S subunit-recycling heat shock protein
MEQPNLPIIEYSEYGRTIKATASGGERLDVFLASSCGETRSYVRRLIVEGEASINGNKGRCKA